MALKYRAEEYEAMDEGIYRAKLVNLEEDEGEFGPFLKWYFEILEEDYEGQSVRGQSSIPQNFTSATKMWQWAQGLMGRAIQAGEQIDLEELIGNECMITISHKETDRGTFARIDSVNPIRRKKKKKPAPEPELEEDEDEDNDLSEAPF
jgi:hypothetical protein